MVEITELNELVESIIVDVAEEGVGTTAGIGLLWGFFFCGTFAAFAGILELLSSAI